MACEIDLEVDDPVIELDIGYSYSIPDGSITAEKLDVSMTYTVTDGDLTISLT